MTWNFYLWLQKNNHRVPKQRPMWEFQRAAFQTDPADYTEIGQAYRRKSICGSSGNAGVVSYRNDRTTHYF
jgi:hypothetical protein